MKVYLVKHELMLKDGDEPVSYHDESRVLADSCMAAIARVEKECREDSYPTYDDDEKEIPGKEMKFLGVEIESVAPCGEVDFW